MKNTLLLTIVLLGITACNTDTNTKESIEITAKCNLEKNTSNYQVLQSGDVISKKELLYTMSSNEPEVEIFHSENGLKTICYNSGTAVILR